jgi:hypothetical protein
MPAPTTEAGLTICVSCLKPRTDDQLGGGSRSGSGWWEVDLSGLWRTCYQTEAVALPFRSTNPF